ncbi:hypothetical protein C8R46DRAFT_1035810 [Mycena filopes]|nr:hypothetical protein C8R46DRAFT_1035810 [Mycena filopes]
MTDKRASIGTERALLRAYTSGSSSKLTSITADSGWVRAESPPPRLWKIPSAKWHLGLQVGDLHAPGTLPSLSSSSQSLSEMAIKKWGARIGGWDAIACRKWVMRNVAIALIVGLVIVFWGRDSNQLRHVNAVALTLLVTELSEQNGGHHVLPTKIISCGVAGKARYDVLVAIQEGRNGGLPAQIFYQQVSAGFSVRQQCSAGYRKGENGRVQLEADRAGRRIPRQQVERGNSNGTSLHNRKYSPVNLPIPPTTRRQGHPTNHSRASPRIRKRAALHRNALTLPNGAGFLPGSTRDGIGAQEGRTASAGSNESKILPEKNELDAEERMDGCCRWMVRPGKLEMILAADSGIWSVDVAGKGDDQAEGQGGSGQALPLQWLENVEKLRVRPPIGSNISVEFPQSLQDLAADAVINFMRFLCSTCVLSFVLCRVMIGFDGGSFWRPRSCTSTRKYLSVQTLINVHYGSWTPLSSLVELTVTIQHSAVVELKDKQRSKKWKPSPSK